MNDALAELCTLACTATGGACFFGPADRAQSPCRRKLFDKFVLTPPNAKYIVCILFVFYDPAPVPKLIYTGGAYAFV